MKDLKKIQEFFSKKGLKEDAKPRVVKDKNHPNFLSVYIDYPTGDGALTALGKETMSGQARKEGAAKALKAGQVIAAKLRKKYNIEDINVQDLENGKVHVFAVSDDFIDMKTGDGIKEGMEGQLDEPYFIEVSVRDARKALGIFEDRYKESDIKMYGSNVYAADSDSNIYDLYQDLMTQDIEVLGYNVDEANLDEEKGHSPQLVSKENPTGETKGLDPETMSRILMKIMQDIEERKQ